MMLLLLDVQCSHQPHITIRFHCVSELVTNNVDCDRLSLSAAGTFIRTSLCYMTAAPSQHDVSAVTTKCVNMLATDAMHAKAADD
jgi:hypothetical protein